MNARHLVIPALLASAFAVAPALADDNLTKQDPYSSGQTSQQPGASQQDPAPVQAKVSDDSITSQVEAAVANPSVKAKTKDGVVTLKGKVDSRESAEAASQRASTVPGVVSVKNELKIKS